MECPDWVIECPDWVIWNNRLIIRRRDDDMEIGLIGIGSGLPRLGLIVLFHLLFKGERDETCRHKGGDRKIQERESGKKVIDAHKAC